MKIKQLLWYDGDTKEADAIVENDGGEMRVYFDRYTKDADYDKAIFCAFGVKDIALTDKNQALGVHFSSEGSFETSAVAKIKSVENQTVEVYGVTLELDEPLPGGLLAGDKICFKALRITCIFR